MKAVSLLLLLLLPLLPALGQATLPLDEHGKVVFYEVVAREGTPKEALYAAALGWLGTNAPDYREEREADGTAYRFTATRQIPVYAKGYVSKQLHGTISYQFTLELKDGRYRYYCRDFVFHYHKVDRTYKVVPTGQTKPLEDPKAPGWQQTWKSHQQAVAKTMHTLAADLNNALQQRAPEAKIAKSATVTENW
ncbi:MAG TPA: DUF4468 domain-containing protein [Cytophagales bacterium]